MELISRDQAIKCLNGEILISRREEADALGKYFKMAIARLKALPTIEEREEGHWEHIDGTGWYRCSECGEKEKMKGSFQPYCRWCGARMKGE